MDNIERVLAIITSVIGILTAIYKVGFRNNRKRLEEYYQKVLVPFVTKYKKNQNINAIAFLNKKIKVKDENIPKYIFYLMDEQKEVELKKVLIYDYLDIYHNDDTAMNQIMRQVSKVLCYIMFFLDFVFIFFGVTYIMTGLYSIIIDASSGIKGTIQINTIELSTLEFTIFQIVMGIMCVVISVLLIKFVKFWNEDIYTVKKNKIEKMISKKVRDYDNNKDKYVI